MKILFVTPRFPFPPLKGDQAVAYCRLKTLSQRHEITLLSLYETEAELAGVAELAPFCKNIHTVRLPKWRSIWQVASRVLFSKLPLQVLYYQSSTLINELNRVMNNGSFDVVHGFMLRLAPYLFRVERPVVLELIDSMQLNISRRLERERFPMSLIIAEEFSRIRAFESELGQHFKEMIVVSSRDRDVIASGHVSVIPLGVDATVFSPRYDTRPRFPTILFSGNMSYGPNVEAVSWFANECLHLIRRFVPDLEFVIAGGNPTETVRALGCRAGVRVTGYVDSMSETMNRAHVAVAPMVSGSGMQFKILEAMACAIPVVTTEIGKGDIKATKDDGLFVSNDPTSFALSVIELLRNAELRSRAGHAGRAFVLRAHSWAGAAEQVEAIYRKIAAPFSVSEK